MFVAPSPRTVVEGPMIETLQRLNDRRPFEPYAIVMTNGERFEVRYPNTLAIGKQMANLIDPESDRWQYIRIGQITSVDHALAAA